MHLKNCMEPDIIPNKNRPVLRLIWSVCSRKEPCSWRRQSSQSGFILAPREASVLAEGSAYLVHLTEKRWISPGPRDLLWFQQPRYIKLKQEMTASMENLRLLSPTRRQGLLLTSLCAYSLQKSWEWQNRFSFERTSHILLAGQDRGKQLRLYFNENLHVLQVAGRMLPLLHIKDVSECFFTPKLKQGENVFFRSKRHAPRPVGRRREQRKRIFPDPLRVFPELPVAVTALGARAVITINPTTSDGSDSTSKTSLIATIRKMMPKSVMDTLRARMQKTVLGIQRRKVLGSRITRVMKEQQRGRLEYRRKQRQCEGLSPRLSSPAL
ncbi:uncharacterized protein LOC135328114 isoform X1 [Dromaius novaehollandiae]|uniref:uncharacterized protein LOC135328114 isoform X1 n=1 Tax=Dromaius novaehollandiae TaxID=8790 RepID=UPI00311D7F46